MTTVERNAYARQLRDSARKAGLRPGPVTDSWLLGQLQRIEKKLDNVLRCF